MPTSRILATAAVLATLAGPATAQSEPEPLLPDNFDEILREMMEDVAPAIREMLELMRAFDGIDDARHYMLPEILPNGDIIIRRRPGAPPFGHDETPAPTPTPDPPETEPGQPEEDGSIKT